MKLKHLESILSQIPQHSFPSPNIQLEQYPTSPHLASSVILTALSKGDLGEGKSALDLGCGTGILALGCCVVGCDIVYGVDCDEEVIKVAKENLESMLEEEEEEEEEVVRTKVEFVLGRIHQEGVIIGNSNNSGGGGGGGGRGRGGRNKTSKRSSGRGRGGRIGGRAAQTHTATPPPPTNSTTTTPKDGIPLTSKIVDTVLTNPPFGTKHNAGIDIQFLRVALRLATKAVYSFHKSSTRDYIVKTVKCWNEDARIKKEGGGGDDDDEKKRMEVEVVAQMRFDIGNTYKFHTKKSVDVDVDLIRVYFVDDDDDHTEEQDED